MDIDLLDDMDFTDLDLTSQASRRRRNILRIRFDPFEELDENEFRYKYRFTKRYARAIVDLIKDDILREPRGATISPQIQVTCALRNWARHEPSVSVICKNVAEALAKRCNQFIKMPATLMEQETEMRKFRSIANFPTVVGAIDCTHVKIKKSNAEGGQAFINRKGFSSINVQAVCNADLKIMNIVARWRGSAHDSRIFRECRLKQRFEAGAFNGILLGDSGYPCTHYLFTPILNPQTPQEERYNAAQIRTRNTIERCFGLLKQHFRCLLRGMFGNIETMKKTIVAVAILHNIAIDMKEDLPPEEYNDPGAGRELVYHRIPNTVRGNVRRRQFIETHF